MRKNSADEFYVKIFIWTLFCLAAALVGGSFREMNSAANESAALSKIALVHRLQMQHAAKHRGRFAADFDELIETENLDKAFAGENPLVHDYVFEMKVSNATADRPAFYSIAADPHDVGGNLRHFYIDSTLRSIRMTDANRSANAADPPI